MRPTDSGLVLETTRPSIFPKKVVYVLVRARTSPKIVRWAFLLVVFAMPFDTLPEAIRGPSALARIAGLLFFSICLLYPKVCFRRPPQALWWFAGYVFVYVLSGLLIPEQFIDVFVAELQAFIQLLGLCWIGSTLLQDEKFTRHTLLTFSIATLLVAMGMFLGLPGFSLTWGRDRLSTTGFNPNGLAVIMAMGSQALIGFGIDQTLRNVWMRAIFMIMSLFPLTIMVYTGSRGGIIAFLAGVALYALPYRRSKRKMAAILGATIAVVGVVYIAVNNQSILSRFERTYETGDTAGRDTLFAASIEMISEKPVLGWRPVMWAYELGRREGLGKQARDAHNLYLHLLLEVGLLGAVPFLIGLGLCVRAAWTARDRSLGLLLLAWLTSAMVGSMAGTTIGSKLLWLVIMLNLASELSMLKQYKRKSLISRIVLQQSKNRNTNHATDIYV